jgi:hypothetical protein
MVLAGTWQARQERLETTKSGMKALVAVRKALLGAHGEVAGHSFRNKHWQGPSMGTRAWVCECIINTVCEVGCVRRRLHDLETVLALIWENVLKKEGW